MKRYDSYKDSGVEWIGEIPSHWDLERYKHLGDSSSTNISVNEFQNRFLILKNSLGTQKYIKIPNRQNILLCKLNLTLPSRIK